MKRSRGRSRRQGNPANRSYDSNGPEVKVRGNPSTVYEKYLSLAGDALTSGNPVKAENLFQHAEHYYRIIAASQTPKSEEESDANAVNGNGVAGGSATEPLVLNDDADENGAADAQAHDEPARNEKGEKGRRRGPLRRRSKPEVSNKSATPRAAETETETETSESAEPLDLSASQEKSASA